MAVRPDSDAPGAALIQGSWLGTAVFTITAVAAAIWRSAFWVPAVVVAVALFVIGCGMFLWAFARGVDRSRLEAVSVADLYLLTGAAPRDIKWRLHGSTAVQTVVAVATASARPFTTLAFGILVPMFGLGIGGLWAARHGHFEPRLELDHKRPRHARAAAAPAPDVDQERS